MLTAIAEVIPHHITPERMIKVGLMALNNTPKLQECDRGSFLQAMMECSSLGLEPDGRRCHLIPYGKTCQLIIDYKGLIELAKRSGEVATWRAEVVREKDEFIWENGEITHRVDFRQDRGAAQCYYSHVKNKDGSDDYEVMTIEDVKAIQARSKAGKSGPWITDFDEMGKKTVMRRHSKRLTLSPEFGHALTVDADQLSPMKATHGERLTTTANPFEKGPKPLTLAGLISQEGITEGEALIMLTDAGVCSVDTKSIDDLCDDQKAHAVRDWKAIMKEASA